MKCCLTDSACLNQWFIWHQLLSQVLTRFNLIYFILVLCIHICSIISRSYHSFWLWHVRYKNSGFLVGNELNIENFSMIWNVKGNNSTQILAKDLQKVSKLTCVIISQKIRLCSQGEDISLSLTLFRLRIFLFNYRQIGYLSYRRSYWNHLSCVMYRKHRMHFQKVKIVRIRTSQDIN